MIPPALIADGAGYQRGISFLIHGLYNFANQTTPGMTRIPVAAARFGAVAGKPKPFFRYAPLPGGIDKRLVDYDRLIEVFDVTRCILNAEQGGSGLGNRTGAEKRSHDLTR